MIATEDTFRRNPKTLPLREIVAKSGHTNGEAMTSTDAFSEAEACYQTSIISGLLIAILASIRA